MDYKSRLCNWWLQFQPLVWFAKKFATTVLLRWIWRMFPPQHCHSNSLFRSWTGWSHSGSSERVWQLYAVTGDLHKQEQLELTLDSPDTDVASRATPKAFVAAMAPTAKVVVEQLGIDPHTVKTQAALEIDWWTPVKDNNPSASSITARKIDLWCRREFRAYQGTWRLQAIR